VFVVLFVGFCVVFAWMVWRKKDDKKKDEKPQA
jgi:preprotein translocase subunit SecG